MRNGLYGSAKEARVIWTRLSFSDPNYYLRGSAETVKAVNLPIEAEIIAFAVLETDKTAFLMAQLKNYQVLLHIVPGPANPERALQTFSFLPNIRISFAIEALILLPEAKKAIFYTENHLGEINLSDYPFEQGKSPTIKIYEVQGGEDNLIGQRNLDSSGSGSLYQVRPVYLGDKWAD